MDLKNVESIYPLAPAQADLLARWRQEPDPDLHNGQLTCELRGTLDAEAFDAAWQSVAERHTALRTSFMWKRLEQPLQIVRRRANLPLARHDWRDFTTDEQQVRWAELLRAERERDFDPTTTPLSRLTLCRVADDRHLLVWTYHRLALDRSSLRLVLDEVLTLHEAARGTAAANDLAPARPYRDYVSQVSGQGTVEAEAFLRAELGDLRETFSLGLGTPSSAVGPGRHFYRQQLSLSSETTAALTAFDGHGVDLDTILLGAWALLLSHYSGEPEVWCGVTFSARPAATQGSANIVGPLLNTLPLKVRIPTTEPLVEWLNALAARRRELNRYAHVAPSQWQRWSAAPPDANPIESTVIIAGEDEDDTLAGRESGLLRMRVEVNEQTGAQLAIAASRDETVTLQAFYDARYFEGDAVGRMLEGLAALLLEMAADLARTPAEVPVLSADERRRLLVEWNDTTTNYPREQTVARLFEQQAELTPAAPSLLFGGESLTYRELNERANRLAHHLRSLGVGPEVAVGVSLPRSPELIIALLAVLKAGGAYVPLDLSYPTERITFMLEDAQVAVLVTREDLMEELPSHWAQVVCVDAEEDIIGGESDQNPVSSATPDNIAYVMYTSGSTGTPKGVAVTHRNIVRLVRETDYADFGSGEVFLQLAPISFDASTFEVWGSLLNGARLAIMQTQTPTPDELAETLDEFGVTTLWLTAGLFHLMVDEHASVLRRVRQVLAGGDALSAPHVRRLLGAGDAVSGWRLINGYGPTESTTFACCYTVTSTEQLNGSVPIGYPIANTTAYVLNRQLRPVPVGVPGELFIGGDGLARGYHARPELTAERFIPDPFSREPGARLYRTGDLVRRLPDGRLEFLGRRDTQVKVRGFRIELGEVEAVLSQHPAFREAVVIARSDEAGGEKRLVAYVVTEEGQTLTSAEMREYLKEKLPDYMVPAQLVSLDELPLTPNGKVDRRALPAPEAVHAEDAAAFAPPETAREQVLASAWAHVLGVERVGVNDNFFDLGGDSIRSIQIRSLVQKQGYDFSLQQLFQHQTIGELSPLLTEFESSVRPEMKTAPFSLISARDRERMPEDVEDAYPIAMLQMGMLFHNELSRETPIYHDIFSFHLRAPFDEGLMREALSQLMNRHAVLRTSFDLAGYEEPLQLVHRHVEAPLEIEDLRALSADEQRRELDAWIEREKGRHFDLALPPYIRFGLFRRSDDTFQFALSFHHAILDGWSLASMLTELFTLYTMLLDPLPQPLAPPPTLTYRDFIALERDALGSGECQLFWTERLTSDAATTLPRWPGFEPEDGRRLYEVRYTPGFVEELRIFARASGVPLKSVLLAAHVRVLSTVSGQAEVVTGLVTNGRHEGDDGERVLGLFLNTVPFSMRVGAGTWAELAQAARDAEREIIPFRRFPLARMQQEQGGRSLFETNFNFVHFHVVKGLEKFKDLSVISAESFGKTNFTLSVSFTLDPDTSDLLLHIDYDTSVVSHAQVEAMGRYFERAFAAMTREPFARQDREPLLSEDEAHRLLVEWNETYADYPPELCVHQVFEAQAAVTPDAAAVVFEGESLTYRELNERANQLAHYLRRLGVGPEVLVGVLMERSLEMVVALFAVLKAGGAYVPLDPDYPGDRLTFMLHDSRVPLVLTQEKFRMLLSGLSYDQDGEVVVVDSAWDAIAGRESRDNPESGVTAENLIYVIYTSGSTGKPKGAMLTHGGIVNCLLWMQAAYGLDASDAFLFKTSLNFDPSVWELFWPLWFGGRVVVARPGGGGDSAYLMELAEREKVTSLYLVPSLLAIVVEDPALERVTSLRRVISGGEKLPTETIARFISRVSAELHHSYGPTETSIAATEWTCRADYPLRVVPMGRPLANTRVYILDSHMQPSPIGVPGELFIGGEGVGRGYLGRRDLTAARFIPDPFTEEQGARLYRTGDLARYLPDGQIEFVGRVDDQVKVRGYRIELGEIEAALREHRGVRDCVVAARADGGAAQLVAYVVPEVEETATSAGSSVASDGLTPNDLRLHLRMILPDYMVPSAFVFLDALPLTPSGKVDRRALPAPDAHAPDAAKHVAPRTPAEEIVAGIWTEVLGLSAVGATDDFFELGGHSLLATQVVSRVRESFGVELPLTRLFENSTVEGLAAHVEALARDGEQMVAPPIRRAPRDEELPLSFAQQRQWFLHQLDPEGYAYNIPAAVRLRGELHVTALEQTFAELVRRHESLRTVFAARGGVPVQIINPPAPFSLEVEDLSGLPDEATREARARELAAEEARRPFDLTRGPLLRASLLRLDESYQVLLLTMHHIVSDAWSLGVLIRDMVTLYEAFTKGEPSPLSELSVQYADYARWQREWLRGEVLEHQLAYWKKQLGGNTAPLELPADHEAGAVGYRGASLNFNLSTELTEQLKTMSRREGVTLFMTLLAVFKTLLHFQTGRDDITIGANVAGRNRAEIENLIGFFVNPLVLRTSVSGDPAFTELLGRVRETALGAYAHQDVPFEKLVEAFGGDRDPTRSPLFQIAFTLDNTPQQSIQLTRLELSVLDVELETTPFNLVLAMTDTGPGLVGSFQYNTEVFEGATIARLLRHFEMLLSAVAERPDARLSELREALAAGEQQRQAARQRNLREARSKMLRDAKKPATKSATQGGAVS